MEQGGCRELGDSTSGDRMGGYQRATSQVQLAEHEGEERRAKRTNLKP